MWVTQTYLGTVEPDAEVFVYYFYLDYVTDQQRFTAQLQHELEELGEIFGGKVSLQMPNPRYAGRIEAEVRENRALWEALHPKLPGLFLSTSPLSRINAYDSSCFFVPLASGVSHAVSQIKKLADEAITWGYQQQNQPKKPSLAERFFDSLELKPGVGGFKIDLRRFFRG